MAYYETLTKNLIEKIQREHSDNSFENVAFDEKNVLRRKTDHDNASLLRPAFIRDVDKILNCPYYNRYSDKTQVFSLYKNDDITRRGLHVQLVSRIARTIGKALHLNLELIEAISLGHDIGHTPFGHTGEKFLDELYWEHTGRHFAHNIHSVRVLDKIFPLNISLQTLNGIAAHNGELELDEYKPVPLSDEEAAAIIRDEPSVTVAEPFVIGDMVIITDGPFRDFKGRVDSIDDAAGKVTIIVPSVGRDVRVEADKSALKKVNE